MSVPVITRFFTLSAQFSKEKKYLSSFPSFGSCFFVAECKALWALQRLRQKQLGPTEDVRQVWSALSSVLEELGQSCGTTHAFQEEDVPDTVSRLDAVCEVVREWGCSLVASDLESLQYLLTRLRAASQHWQQFSGRLDGLSAALQEAVQGEYRGKLAVR